MNGQNILKFFGSRLNIIVDNSEYYDYELSKDDGDYNTEVLNVNDAISYESLIIDTNLTGHTCERNTITLSEYDTHNSDYTYSGISMVLSYNNFVQYFDTTGVTFADIIINNNMFTYTGITGEIHYFIITGFNETLYIDPRLPVSETQVISGFSTTVIDCVERLNIGPIECSIPYSLYNKPWAYDFRNVIEAREEKGWTLDFIFNRNSLPWSSGGVFYYLGVRGDDNPANYADNNLSFGFTDDGRIKWRKKTNYK